MAHQYEIEIKSLLGDKKVADNLIKKMCEIDPESSCFARSKQLNHYFVGGDINTLASDMSEFFNEEKNERLSDIANSATEFSVRTRQKDDQVLFIVKASIDDTTSENGISRIEFEEEVPLSLEELDQKVINAGFSYQAKWSREREEYSFKGSTVCLDKNAGYGYLAEFEKVVDDESIIDKTRYELRSLMAEVGVEELPQERLARMFDHYNNNWSEYYGTDRIFNIE